MGEAVARGGSSATALTSTQQQAASVIFQHLCAQHTPEVVTVSLDGTLRVWQLPQVPTNVAPHLSSPSGDSGDGVKVAAGSHTGPALWTQVVEFALGRERCTSLAYAPVHVAARMAQVLEEAESGMPACTVHSEFIAYHSHVVACGSESGCVYIFHIPTVSMLHEVRPTASRTAVTGLRYNPSGTHLYVTHADGALLVLNASAGYVPVQQWRPAAPEACVCGSYLPLALSDDGKFLATTCTLAVSSTPSTASSAGASAWSVPASPAAATSSLASAVVVLEADNFASFAVHRITPLPSATLKLMAAATAADLLASSRAGASAMSSTSGRAGASHSRTAPREENRVSESAAGIVAALQTRIGRGTVSQIVFVPLWKPSAVCMEHAATVVAGLDDGRILAAAVVRFPLRVIPLLEVTMAHCSPILSMQPVAHGAGLLTTGSDGQVRVWDARRWLHDAAVHAVSASCAGDEPVQVASLAMKHITFTSDEYKHALLLSLRVRNGTAVRAAVSPSNQHLVLASADGCALTAYELSMAAGPGALLRGTTTPAHSMDEVLEPLHELVELTSPAALREREAAARGERRDAAVSARSSREYAGSQEMDGSSTVAGEEHVQVEEEEVPQPRAMPRLIGAGEDRGSEVPLPSTPRPRDGAPHRDSLRNTADAQRAAPFTPPRSVAVPGEGAPVSTARGHSGGGGVAFQDGATEIGTSSARAVAHTVDAHEVQLPSHERVYEDHDGASTVDTAASGIGGPEQTLVPFIPSQTALAALDGLLEEAYQQGRTLFTPQHLAPAGMQRDETSASRLPIPQLVEPLVLRERRRVATLQPALAEPYRALPGAGFDVFFNGGAVAQALTNSVLVSTLGDAQQQTLCLAVSTAQPIEMQSLVVDAATALASSPVAGVRVSQSSGHVLVAQLSGLLQLWSCTNEAPAPMTWARCAVFFPPWVTEADIDFAERMVRAANLPVSPMRRSVVYGDVAPATSASALQMLVRPAASVRCVDAALSPDSAFAIAIYTRTDADANTRTVTAALWDVQAAIAAAAVNIPAEDVDEDEEGGGEEVRVFCVAATLQLDECTADEATPSATRVSWLDASTAVVCVQGKVMLLRVASGASYRTQEEGGSSGAPVSLAASH
ncbi:MAG: hypothetical protein EOO41_00565, partial [Methanobacteriota archaeon]